MPTTSVKAMDLHYNQYSPEQYDRDIVNAVPFHGEIHKLVQTYLTKWAGERKNPTPDVLDLGAGTGITSRLVRNQFRNSSLTVVDFSAQMLKGAKEKLGPRGVEYLVDDYAAMPFPHSRYDIIISVIGMHHQTDEGKQKMFQKIRRALRARGVFIFGDLVTYQNPHKASLAAVRHFHHLVEKAANEQALIEWAHHHIFLNKLAPLEDQVSWLKMAGFKNVSVLFQQLQTALIIAD